MITATENERINLRALSDFDDVCHGDLTDKFLYKDANGFNSLLEERNFFCNSVSSSACPSVTSESSATEFHLNQDDTDLDLFLFDRMVDLTPHVPCNKIKTKHAERLKNKSPLKIKSQKKTLDKEHTKNKCFRKKWSDLSQKERTKELEYLMQKTSEKLGLREQLDVIKIVNPKAELAPSATEFFIDFDLINDENYEKIYDYVNKELKRLKEADDLIISKTNVLGKRKKSSNQVGSLKRKSGPRSEQRENVKREKLTKRGQQLRKEKKSGLFSREQVVAMASFRNPSENHSDDEEVDILT